MTRLIVTLIFAGLVAAAVAWVAATPGGVILTIGTYQAQMSVGIAFVLLLACAFALMLIFKILGAIWRIPRLWRDNTNATPAPKTKPQVLSVQEAKAAPASAPSAAEELPKI